MFKPELFALPKENQNPKPVVGPARREKNISTKLLNILGKL
jgi:hypothetical protein